MDGSDQSVIIVVLPMRQRFRFSEFLEMAAARLAVLATSPTSCGTTGTRLDTASSMAQLVVAERPVLVGSLVLELS